ncbi:maleylpyruvate isomerase family mycothiol-dependent enzyme [Nocardioides conyzicola]|uniref:Maleylpyruvate isomerase family mycothiol-dependent enzyme n=1 Tax=Nocardioides conyzicola TaxID=1651781 RepID=A0ABP8Y154_9ACTN
MTELVDRAIAALRTNHDALAALVPDLDEGRLTGPSGASEWTVAQALSHLGSGAEISTKPIATAAGLPVEAEDNQSVWARWDGSSPLEQAAGFVEHDSRYLDVVEGLTAEQRADLTVDMGFLPEPVPLVVAVGMRLNEVAAHAWDVRVGLDPAAGIEPESAALLLELYAGPLGFLLGFAAKPDQLAEEARVTVPGGGITVADAVTVTTDLADPTATFTGPAEAAARLLTGRLKPEFTPAGVEVTGNVSLDDLRKVFPGY